MSSALVVFSIALISTLVLELIGAFACFIGLKLKIADKILFTIACRVRRSVPKQLRVAVVSTASLFLQCQPAVPSS